MKGIPASFITQASIPKVQGDEGHDDKQNELNG
jgi:hypothetical protein